MGVGEICGFRLIEDREGEIELGGVLREVAVVFVDVIGSMRPLTKMTRQIVSPASIPASRPPSMTCVAARRARPGPVG